MIRNMYLVFVPILAELLNPLGISWEGSKTNVSFVMLLRFL